MVRDYETGGILTNYNIMVTLNYIHSRVIVLTPPTGKSYKVKLSDFFFPAHLIRLFSTKKLLKIESVFILATSSFTLCFAEHCYEH